MRYFAVTSGAHGAAGVCTDPFADADWSASAAAPPVHATPAGMPREGALADAELLANMSHELRTPLNAVIGFTDLVLNEVYGPLGDPRYREYLALVRAGGEHLLTVANSILEFAQAVAGRVVLHPCATDAGAVVAACARAIALQAKAAGVEVAIEPCAPATLIADPCRLQQALTNILSNAINASAPGGRVSIGASPGPDGETIVFSVADDGVGMTPGQVDVATRPFCVVDNVLTRRHGGIGLGLPLADRLVRMHGGELRIVSRPGQGTLVTVSLPQAGTTNDAVS